MTTSRLRRSAAVRRWCPASSKHGEKGFERSSSIFGFNPTLRVSRDLLEPRVVLQPVRYPLTAQLIQLGVLTEDGDACRHVHERVPVALPFNLCLRPDEGADGFGGPLGQPQPGELLLVAASARGLYALAETAEREREDRVVRPPVLGAEEVEDRGERSGELSSCGLGSGSFSPLPWPVLVNRSMSFRSFFPSS